VNIFMPYPDLQQSVCCLDSKRLGNQVYREAKTLICGGWEHHPAAKLWAKHKYALACYALYGLDELEKRGRSYPRWVEFFREQQRLGWQTGDRNCPPLVGHEPFHSGHRAALLAKGIMDETHRLIKFEPRAPHWLRRQPKSSWDTDDYARAWEILGYRPPGFYAQYNWTEKPIFNTKDAYVWSIL
jgi:hypothetical protein